MRCRLVCAFRQRVKCYRQAIDEQDSRIVEDGLGEFMELKAANHAVQQKAQDSKVPEQLSDR